MSRYPFEVRWNGKLQHYVATCKQLPDVAVMAKTRDAAMREMRRVLAEKASLDTLKAEWDAAAAMSVPPIAKL